MSRGKTKIKSIIWKGEKEWREAMKIFLLNTVQLCRVAQRTEQTILRLTSRLEESP